MKSKSFFMSPFFVSLSLGLISWILIFFVFSLEPVFPLSNKLLSYVLLSYLSIILGYLVIPDVKKEVIPNSSFIYTNSIKLIILIVLISFLLRYIDLFLIRGASFSYSIRENRILIQNESPNLIFIIASVTRYLFFVPIILFLHSKKKSKNLLFLCLFLFLLPFVEGMIRGTRNSFFYPTILLVITLLYFKKIKFKKLHISIILIVSAVLFLIATSILKKREVRNESDYKKLTSISIYNDFLKPKKFVIEKIHKTKNEQLKQLLISGLQTGQYYTHGLYEFNHLIKTYEENKELNFQYGKFIFFNYCKLTNRLGITNLDLYKIKSANPREYSFITFFGGLYIDFGWFGLIVMFFLGMIQKLLFNQVKKKNAQFLPLFIFLIFVNFFMLIFNFLAGSGSSFITISIFVILIISYKKNKMSKKINQSTLL